MTFTGRSLCPPAEQLAFLRHKERKFGRGCLEASGERSRRTCWRNWSSN